MYILPELPYPYEALEPYLDKETMLIHHTKHHQAYTDKLNAALESFPELADKRAEVLLQELAVIPEAIRTAVKNNGGGYVNHNLFWTILGPANQRQSEPKGKLAEVITRDFGSFADLVKQLKEKAAGHFGSGWVWLVTDEGKEKLQIIATSNQDSPLSQSLIPILGLDVWEHAYYLKYQNRRAEYLDSLFNVINWKAVEEKFSSEV